MKKILKIATISVFFGIYLTKCGISFALEENPNSAKSYEGIVREVLEETRNESGGYYQKLKVEVLTGDIKGQEFEVELGLGNSPVTQNFKKGDRVVLVGYTDSEGLTTFFIDDFVRRGPMLLLFLIFIILTLVIAGKKGLSSFLGMFITFYNGFLLRCVPRGTAFSTCSNAVYII